MKPSESPRQPEVREETRKETEEVGAPRSPRLLGSCGFSPTPGRGAGQPIFLPLEATSLPFNIVGCFGLLPSSPLPGNQAAHPNSLLCVYPGAPPIPSCSVRGWHSPGCWPASCLCQCLITFPGRA